MCMLPTQPIFLTAGDKIIWTIKIIQPDWNCVCLLLRCQEAEGLTAFTDDDALVKVANSINGARYFESVLKEWCEDVFFLEIGSNQSDQPRISVGEQNGNLRPVEGLET
ncbi:hypothetical protein M0R45_023238 [Rubus argutus]|uniref:Uncharacterized protein n=1 Tax=Rubus argutus TaxID=59490 RepID=A0AAW1WRL5_RUBAR